MNTVTVTQLNTYIKSVIDSDAVLNRIFVVGELSNFNHHYKSGHMYMTLKDDKTQIKAVMFSGNASRLRFRPENGMSVICRGRVSIYDRDSSYQLYIDDMQPDGIGALTLAYEQLRARLEKEGLFDIQHKKQIPQYPKKIGVVTSNTGAAVEDIKNITKRRYPIAQLVIAPTIVQGNLAVDDIVKSIKLLDSIDDIDVIIVGRGGGSIEDLWAFNSEEVARAVFECKKPIISAVGHETDYTICDFTADYRAETPSAAAVKVTPDMNSILDFLTHSQIRMSNALNSRLEREYQRLDYIANDSVIADFNDYLSNHYDIVESYDSEIRQAYNEIITKNQFRLSAAAGKLNALSPLAVLARGYSAVTDKNDRIVNSAKTLKIGDSIKISFADSSAVCTVDEVNNNGNDI